MRLISSLLFSFLLILPSLGLQDAPRCNHREIRRSVSILKVSKRLIKAAKSRSESVRRKIFHRIQKAHQHVSRARCTKPRRNVDNAQPIRRNPRPCAWCNNLPDGNYTTSRLKSGEPTSSCFSCTAHRLTAVQSCGFGHVFASFSHECVPFATNTPPEEPVVNMGGTEEGARRRLAAAEASSRIFSLRMIELNALLPFKAGVLDPFDALASWDFSPRSIKPSGPLSDPSLPPFFCSWLGISCSTSSFRISSISLSGLSLSGNHLFPNSIPPQWGDLLHLSSLDLSDNAGLLGTSGLTGSIPPSLLALPRLHDIWLSSNAFSGPLPANIGQMKSLSTLLLADNLFSGPLPASIGQLRALTLLDLSRNQLSGKIPGSMGYMGSLSLLYMQENQFTGSVPPSFARCSSLVYMNLSSNALSGPIPPVLADMPSLGSWDLGNNRFSGPLPTRYNPLAFGMELQNNNISGHIPPALFIARPLLFTLDLSGNRLSGAIPDEVTQSTFIYYLDLSNNQLEGRIPEELPRALTGLLKLNVSGNQLTGRIPSFETARSLHSLDLSSNRLSGPVPVFDCTNSLKNLQILALGNNRLSGRLPPSLSSCPSLSLLSVENNSLSGPVHFLWGMQSLQTLRLRDNLFAGHFPLNVSCSSSLLQADLSGNRLEGPVPPSLFASCSALSHLDLSRNRLNGSLPDLSSLFPSIQQQTAPRVSPGALLSAILAALSTNNITLSSSFLTPTGSSPLSSLNLSSNSLGGPLLDGFLECVPNLKTVDLSENGFQGPLPTALLSLHGLQTLNVRSNKLTGPVPDGLPLNLISLDLSNNLFSGQLPSDIAFLQHLKALDLSLNRGISGPLGPLSLLRSLLFLNISSDSFSGHVLEGPPFSSFPASSFLDNPQLCGGLGYPGCKSDSGSGLSTGMIVAVAIICGVALIVFAALGVAFMTLRRREKKTRGNMLVFERLGFRLTFEDLKAAAEDFNDRHLLGKGGFGSVYRATLKDGRQVAIKRLSARSSQGNAELEAEMKTLGSVQHKNLVKLVAAYIAPPPSPERLLIYKFFPGGSLDAALAKVSATAAAPRVDNDNPLRKWKVRHSIALHTARGMKYLHHDCSPPIVHCDMKPANILLDENMVACVADFGLACELDTTHSHMSIAVHGTVGYLAPEYIRHGRLTLKSDVYAYGVVLLQLISGRKPTQREGAFRGLAHWVGTQPMDRVVDLALGDALRVEEHRAEIEGAINLGLLCTSRIAADRPSMVDVVHVLENLEAFGNTIASPRMSRDIQNPWNMP